MSIETQPQIAEIVTFSLKDGVTDQTFLDLIAPSHAFASAAPGYVSRRLSKGADGAWTDYVVWDSLDQAQAAAADFMKQDFAPALMEVFNTETLEMRHQSVLWHPS